jgi:hypothetical protein
MARATKKTDYLNLPFEIHYSRMNTVSFELMYNPDKPPKTIKGYKVIEAQAGRVFDVTFRCGDPSSGKLIYVLKGNLDELIPEWLEKISDDDNLDIKWARRSKFRIEDNVLELDDNDKGEYDDYEYGDHNTFDYSTSGSGPDYLIVDADNSRIKIDMQGYKLGVDNKRIGKLPIVTYTEEQSDETDVIGRDEYDVRYEIARWFD